MKRVGLILLGALSGLAGAQGGISLFGQMNVIQGGFGFVQGRVQLSQGTPIGSFTMSFTQGDLLSVRTNQVVSLFVPGVTAGFDSIATATIKEGNVTHTVTGRMHVYVDDLSGLTPSQPDQMILTFQPRTGSMIVRHGRMHRGDIAVTF